MTAVPHLGFIVAAYAVTALVLAGAAVAILFDGRALRRGLARMEARGERRRETR